MFGLGVRWTRSRPSRLAKLAETIDSLVLEDERAIAEAHRVAASRRTGAEELYRLCAKFADDLNAMLKRTEVVLDPPEFSSTRYTDYGDTIFQIHVRGRILLLCFAAAPQLISTENFREPYILEGAIRSFNQDSLDRASLEEKSIFYCTSPEGGTWHYFDPRTYQTGPLGEDYLVSSFEALV